MPDLDSDSGVPVRELFNVGAMVVPLLLVHNLAGHGFTLDQILALFGHMYVAIRFGLSQIFRHLTVHRGIFHSIPAMFIAGLVVFDLHRGPTVGDRLYLAGGTMLGFLSHLVLDELCSVDFKGKNFILNKYAGSALKLFSPSWVATLTAYALLIWLGLSAYREVDRVAPHPLAQLLSKPQTVLRAQH